jgi:DNA modification methylase
MYIRGEIFLGDCLDLAGKVKGGVDLVYADPPYFTRRVHQSENRAKDEGGRLHFEDRWKGEEDGEAAGRREYLKWLRPRIEAMRDALKPGGVFLLHLDWHAVHYAKVMCDEIFGDAHFQNELIWHYQTGGASKGRFSRKHDTILFYSRGKKFYFDGKAIAIPRGAGAMKRAQCATGARIKATDTHKNPDDVLMVPALNPMAVERTGYPTQKPLELLERLIKALCPRDGVVADFFCGSGTTLAAAKKLGRKYVGGDESAKAVSIARRRLAATTTR